MPGFFVAVNRTVKPRILLALWFLTTSGCRTPSRPVSGQAIMGWRPVASWSGHANYQTDSFHMGTGQWRIKWEATNLHSTTGGSLRVVVHSSISGRFVIVAVDQRGAGKGIAYIAEDPRDFFLVVESSGVDWNVGVDEGEVGQQ